MSTHKPPLEINLSEQRYRVLHQLRYYPRDSYTLSYYTGYPQASVRRTIRELRELGYSIASSYWGYELKREKPLKDLKEKPEGIRAK